MSFRFCFSISISSFSSSNWFHVIECKFCVDEIFRMKLFLSRYYLFVDVAMDGLNECRFLFDIIRSNENAFDGKNERNEAKNLYYGESIWHLITTICIITLCKESMRNREKERERERKRKCNRISYLVTNINNRQNYLQQWSILLWETWK